MFDADHPIEKSSQDCLGRTVFAKYLARAMLDHQDLESLVIGLSGGWGSGKTSVINLMIEELNFAASNMLEEEKPIVLNFNPWAYSGQQQLIYNFFRLLSSTLHQVPQLKNGDRITHLLELYISFFTHQAVPKSLRTKRSLPAKLTFKGREEIYAWESGRDLASVKAELNQLLQQQKHKIIIVVDNISRLYDYEIKQLFQIVKAMGDYTNTIYLLAFDKEQIIKSINKLDGSGGKEFIEKVVQLPFEIPSILQEDVEKIFANRLSDVLAMMPIDTWNAEYWADIYYESLRFFFKNCRDITRYVNTLHFSYARLRDVVNPVDFFALTALEIFVPSIYFGIRDNKDLFSDLLDNVYILDEEQAKKDKLRCDEILARNHHVPHEIILKLLIHLFPRLRHLYLPGTSFYHSDAIAQKLRRICNPDWFDAYFRLSLQPSEIPSSEFEVLLTLAANEETFDHALARLNQDDRMIKFLDQLDSDVIKQLPQENIPSIINALLDDGDLFPQGVSGPLSLDSPMRIHRIIHRLLRRIDQTEKRFLLMQNAIAKATKSIYIIVHELREQAREHQEEENVFLPLQFRDLTPEQLESLRKLTANRIEWWAKTDRLINHPRLLSLLYAWRDWGNEADCRRFVEETITSDRGLLVFLMATLDKAITQAMTEYQKNSLWEKYLEDIEAFISPHQLENHAKILFEDPYFEKLREREQLALMIFLDLIKAPTTKTIPKTNE